MAHGWHNEYVAGYRLLFKINHIKIPKKYKKTVDLLGKTWYKINVLKSTKA